LVADKLAHAWAFLSGQNRQFHAVHNTSGTAVAEFAYALPMQLAHTPETPAIVVLIDRADAQSIAAFMFGTPADTLAEADLRDACGEACNVFSDCFVLHLSQNHDVQIGLPQSLSTADFAYANTHSHLFARYESRISNACLTLLVYDSLCLPP
jgi:hypothetical protein